jgi:two-component system cell cycle sensor histidine kinase/response regulator CckA
MSGRHSQAKTHSDLWPGRIALGYCVISLGWIFGSGYLVNTLTSGSTSSIIEIGKGVGFVLITSGALYAILARRAHSIRAAERARAAADEERLRLATAVEQAAEAIVMIDPQGCVIYVNPAFERISGYDRSELIGRDPGLLATTDGDGEDPPWTTLSGDQVWRGTLVNVRKDGTEYELETVISPIFNAAGGLVCRVAVQRDVSHERALERELEEAARMEAVGQLAGGIAHDFNNQLTAIAGYADLLRSEVADRPGAAADVEEILRASKSAAGLVKQLLALARRQVLEPSGVHLPELVEQLKPMLRGLLGPKSELIVDASPETSTVWADARQVEQVLVNLTVNANDAMPDGGRLTIRISNEAVKPNEDAPDMLPAGRYVLLTATDTGVGMDEATLAHAFEPFFTTKAPGRGTGLGLSSTYGIIRQSGGYLFVDSEVGAGSTFRIYLPEYAGPRAAGAEQPSSEPVPGGTETILVVEDEPSVRALLTHSLESLGYRVLVSEDAAGALDLAASDGALPLLVTDIRLPGMDGPTLAGQLRAGRAGMRVLYVSGYAGDAMVNSGLLGPDEAFLAKPFSGDELARRVRSLLDLENEAR